MSFEKSLKNILYFLVCFVDGKKGTFRAQPTEKMSKTKEEDKQKNKKGRRLGRLGRRRVLSTKWTRTINVTSDKVSSTR